MLMLLHFAENTFRLLLTLQRHKNKMSHKHTAQLTRKSPALGLWGAGNALSRSAAFYIY